MEKSSKTSNGYSVERILKSMRENLARFRIAKGYTLERLSKESNVAISRISEIESGDVEDIQLSTVAKLAHALGCPPFELMGVSEPDFTGLDYARLDQAIELLLALRPRKAP